MPSFSPDGKMDRISQRRRRVMHWEVPSHQSPAFIPLPANGGAAKFVTDRGDLPRFNKEGDRIYYQGRWRTKPHICQLLT